VSNFNIDFNWNSDKNIIIKIQQKNLLNFSSSLWGFRWPVELTHDLMLVVEMFDCALLMQLLPV